MNKRVLWVSDLDLKGSGYASVSLPLCDGLAKAGFEVKVAGFGYRGEPHDFPFSIIPAHSLSEIMAMIQNLSVIWKYGALVVALDIPLQERMIMSLEKRSFKYIGIMPVEADPLCMSWAMVLQGMDKPFIISEFGTEEARKRGVLKADHLQVGLDTTSWRPPTIEEKTKLREKYGFNSKDFVVLTVADNQERKNLSACMDGIAQFIKEVPNAFYLLVTREHNQVGWKLREMAQNLGIEQRIMIFERGMSFKELWSVYAVSDAFLLASKAEGLGLPILEAMACKVPVLGTNCTAIHELLQGDRGYLVEYEYIHTDPFGNANRYWVCPEAIAKNLSYVYNNPEDVSKRVEAAYNYVCSKNPQIAVNQLRMELEKE